MGIVLPFSVAENMILHEYNHAPYSRKGFLAFRTIAKRAGNWWTSSTCAPQASTRRSRTSPAGTSRRWLSRKFQRDPRSCSSTSRRAASTSARPSSCSSKSWLSASAAPPSCSFPPSWGAVRHQRPYPRHVRRPYRRRSPARPRPAGGGGADDGGEAERMSESANERISEWTNQRMGESGKRISEWANGRMGESLPHAIPNTQYPIPNTQYPIPNTPYSVRPTMTKHPTLFITHRGERHQQAAWAQRRRNWT